MAHPKPRNLTVEHLPSPEGPISPVSCVRSLPRVSLIAQDAPCATSMPTQEESMLASFHHLRRVFVSVSLLMTLTVSSLYQALVADVPAADDLSNRSSGTIKFDSRQDTRLHVRAGPRTCLSLDEIPLYLRQATVAVKDPTFYDNSNARPATILHAAFHSTRASEIASGNSLLTRQVARLMLLSQDERGGCTVARKLREALLARQLARTWTKDAILETYLNEIDYGKIAYGVEAAAQVYFGLHARELDLAQCTLLAGLPQALAARDPLVNLQAAKAHQKVVLREMVHQGYISQFEAELAYAEPLRFAMRLPLTGPQPQ